MSKLIISDLDDVLHTPPSGFWANCDVVAAKTAIQLGYDRGFDLALKVADRGFEEYGHPCGYFIHDLGMDSDNILHAWLKNLDFSYLEPCNQFIDEMQKSPDRHVILTHSPTFWGNFIIDQLGYNDLFDEVLGCDAYEGRKDTSIKPFETAMSLFGANAEDCIMIDDQSNNLKIPKEMGMKSVLMKTVRYFASEHAHAVYEKPHQIIRAINNRDYPFVV